MSQGPRPAVAFNAFTDKLEHLFGLLEVPTDLEIASLRRDAKALLRTEEPMHGWVALVAVAALQWDLDGARRLAAEGWRTVGPCAFFASNLSVSFRQLNALDDAVEYAREAHRLEPLHWPYLDTLCADLGNTGRFDEALGLATQFLERVGPREEHYPDANEMRSRLESSIHALARAEVSAAQMRTQMLSAFDVLFEQRKRFGVIQNTLDESPEGGCQVAVHILFRGTSEDEMRLGALLAVQLAQLDDWDPSRLVVDFRLAEEARAGDYADVS